MEDTVANIPRCGRREFVEDFRIVEMRRVNDINDVENSDELVRANEQRKRAAEIAEGLALAKVELAR